MPPFDPPQPPEPVDPPNPPELGVPLPPPEVGFGSPWAPADAENRDRILDWWRAWFRSVFFPWIASWTTHWNEWRTALLAYLDSWLDYAGDYIEEHAVAGYSWRKTDTALNPSGTTVVEIIPFDELRPILVGDMVSDTSDMTHYGQVSALVDDTHAVVTTLGSLRGIEGLSWWSTVTPIDSSGSTPVVLPVDADPNRRPQIGDLVSDQSDDTNYGRVTIVTDSTHVTVEYLGSLRGAVGPEGPQGDPGVIQSIVAGTNVTVDDTDPANPIVSATGGSGSGIVESVVAGDNVTVDATDPANPIVSAHGSGFGVVESIVAGTNVTVDDTDPANPIVSAAGGGGSGIVETIVAGARIEVDDTDPANPVVSTANGIPLNVFPTVSRPPALVDGDAYFDSTLIIPVWSYGGMWRDSNGDPVDGPPTIIVDDVDNDGGSYGGIVDMTPITDWDSGLDTFDSLTAVEYGGSLYTAASFRSEGELMVKFDGTVSVSLINAPGTITLRAWTRCVGLWVEGGVIHLIVTTADSESDNVNCDTYHLTYNGSAFTVQTVSGTLGSAYIVAVSPAIDGGYYLYGSTGGGATSGWHFTSDLAATPPAEVDPPDVGQFGQGIGLGTLLGWDDTADQVGEFTGTNFDVYLSSPSISTGNTEGSKDADGYSLAMLLNDGVSVGRAYFDGSISGDYSDGPLWVRNGVGLAFGDTVWVCDPANPLGDHVKFTIRGNGDNITGGSLFYLGGHVYAIAGAAGYDYLVKIAASV